jgi:hypothetical protein
MGLITVPRIDCIANACLRWYMQLLKVQLMSAWLQGGPILHCLVELRMELCTLQIMQVTVLMWTLLHIIQRVTLIWWPTLCMHTLLPDLHSTSLFLLLFKVMLLILAGALCCLPTCTGAVLKIHTRLPTWLLATPFPCSP